MFDSYQKLDNPAWYALNETHACFAIGNHEVKRYRPEIVVFSAYRSNAKNVFEKFNVLASVDESFFLIGELPELASNYVIENTLPCVQMTCKSEIKTTITATITELGEADDEQLESLINLVQPGYYKRDTRLMGDYYGIYENGQLVSVTGERMRMPALTEISAVVTHPDFTGRKYAQQLLAFVSNKNLHAGNIAFLHVAETNERAIRIYEHLGFIKRRMINFTKIKRSA